MERNRQVDRRCQLLHPLNTRNNATGGNSHIPITHIGGFRQVQKLQCAKHIVKIQHGFAAAHNNDTACSLSCSGKPRIKEIDLRQNFSLRQISHRAVEAAGAKRTMHIATHLTGYANAVTIIMVHQHSLYSIAIQQL